MSPMEYLYKQENRKTLVIHPMKIYQSVEMGEISVATEAIQ